MSEGLTFKLQVFLEWVGWTGREIQQENVNRLM